jgi:hypothetical protein
MYGQSLLLASLSSPGPLRRAEMSRDDDDERSKIGSDEIDESRKFI